MKTRKLARSDQPRDDLLDIDVRRVVPEIDKALGLRSQRLRRHQARSPV